MDLVTVILAQGQSAPQGSPFGSFGIMILIFLAMYFLLIAPQRKKQKEHQKMITNLQSGADVITTGGIYGSITNVKDDRFVLKVADNTKIEIAKSAVASVISTESQ